MNFYLKVSVSVVVLVLVALGAMFYFSSGGESKKVEAVIRAAFEAARKGDAEGVIARVSKKFETDGTDYAQACREVRAWIGPGKYKDLELRDLEITVFGDSASAKCIVRIVQPSGGVGMSFNRRLDLGLKKEEGVWMVTSATSPQPDR